MLAAVRASRVMAASGLIAVMALVGCSGHKPKRTVAPSVPAAPGSMTARPTCKVTLTWSPSVPGSSPLAHMIVTTDGLSTKVLPPTATAYYPVVYAGKHTFVVFAQDTAGLTGLPATTLYTC